MSALSILLRNRKRGIFRSSSSRRISCSCGIFFSSASQTTTAASTAGNTARKSWHEFDRPGTVDEGVALIHERGRRGRHLHAHVMLARLLAGVADGRAGLHRTHVAGSRRSVPRSPRARWSCRFGTAPPARYTGGRSSISACSPPHLRAFVGARPCGSPCFQSEWPLASGALPRTCVRADSLPARSLSRSGKVGRRTQARRHLA